MKRYYECTFIVNPGLDDAQIESTVKIAEDTIVKNGGELINTDHIGRRRLAYPITKKHNGFYVCLEFEAEGRIVEKVERFLTLDENVMRYLTVMLDARELEAKRTRAAMLLQEKEKEAEPAGEAKREEKKVEKKDEKKEEEKDEKKDEQIDEKKEEEKDENKDENKDEKKDENGVPKEADAD